MKKVREALEELRPIFEVIRFLAEIKYIIELNQAHDNAIALADAIDWDGVDDD